VGGTLIREAGENHGILFPPQPTEGGIEVVRLLSKDYKMAIVTNVPPKLHNLGDFIEEAGYDLNLFGAVVTSTQIQSRKPQRGIFTEALVKLNVKAGQAVMVGNRVETDVVGAHMSGMRAIFLGSEDAIAARSVSERPDRIIKTIRELPGVLTELSLTDSEDHHLRQLRNR
jgi:putative hydrolase of the HAD superfamily